MYANGKKKKWVMMFEVTASCLNMVAQQFNRACNYHNLSFEDLRSVWSVIYIYTVFVNELTDNTETPVAPEQLLNHI